MFGTSDDYRIVNVTVFVHFHFQTESQRNAKPMSVKSFSRVRKLMPWESTKISAKRLNDRALQNKSGPTTNQYSFAHATIFEKTCKPSVKHVLKGYNAVLIVYGQRGQCYWYYKLKHGKKLNYHCN